MARHQPRPRVRPLQLPRRAQPRRARIDAVAHQGRPRGRPRWLSTSPARGASVEPRGIVRRPPGTPRAPTTRPPAAAPATAAREALEAAHGSAPLLTTAAPWGDPRLYPRLRLAVRRTRRGSTCCGHLARRSPRLRVERLHRMRRLQPRPRADRRRCSPRPPPGAIRGLIRISSSRRIERAAGSTLMRK